MRPGGHVRRHAPWVAALGLLALLAFSPWWAAGRLFAPVDLLHEIYRPWAGDADVRVQNHFTSDGVTQYLFYRRLAERSFAQDGRVGWSSLSGGGRPEYANTMAAYEDWTVQLHRILGFWTAWHLGLLGQLLLAALGMYALLRSDDLDGAVALLGAVLYAGSSQFVLTFFHRWHLAAFAWVPWMVWAMHAARRSGGMAWALVPVFLALSLLGGNLQTNAFTGIVLLGVGTGWAWDARHARAPGAPGPGAAAARAHAASVFLWAGLGLGLAAFALLPRVHAILASFQVGIQRARPGYAHGPLQPLMAALFIPLQAFPTLLGGPRTLDLTKLLDQDYAYIAWFGTIATLVAYRAAFFRAAPTAARLLIAAGLLLPLTPLVGPLYPRVQIVFIFGGVWAFAHYWQHARTDRLERWVVMGLWGFIAAVVLWGALSVASLAVDQRLRSALRAIVLSRIEAGQAGALAPYRGWLLARAAGLVDALRIWSPRQLLFLATTAGGFAALTLRVRRGIRVGALAMLAVAVVELGAFASGWINVVDPGRDPPYPVTPDIAALRNHVGRDDRVFVLHRYAPPLFFPENTLAMYGVPTLQAYETVIFPDMWDALGKRTDAATLGRIGVDYAVGEPGESAGAGWAPTYRGRSLWIWRNLQALPRYTALAPGDDGWLATRKGDARPSAATPGAVRVVSENDDRRVLEVPPGTAMLRIAENWWPGWRYRVEGSAAWQPVTEAGDRSMVASLAPALRPVRVELEFAPPDRRIGWWITAAAAALLVSLAVLRRPRPRRQPS